MINTIHSIFQSEHFVRSNCTGQCLDNAVRNEGNVSFVCLVVKYLLYINQIRIQTIITYISLASFHTHNKYIHYKMAGLVGIKCKEMLYTKTTSLDEGCL